MRKTLLTVLVVLNSASASMAQDFEEGAAAYRQGDYENALLEWQPLAEAGNAGATTMIGLMTAYGRGLPQDHEEAVRLYRLAIELGDTLAIELLGTMYRNGWGVPKDFIEALRLYRLAAVQGNTDALYWLGKGYEDGVGIPQDLNSAHMWFNIACSRAFSFCSDRDRVADNMTPSDVAESQKRARICVQSDFEDCG